MSQHLEYHADVDTVRATDHEVVHQLDGLVSPRVTGVCVANLRQAALISELMRWGGGSIWTVLFFMMTKIDFIFPRIFQQNTEIALEGIFTHGPWTALIFSLSLFPTI